MDNLAIDKDGFDNSAKVGYNLLWITWSGIVSIANSLLVWVFLARMRDVEEVGRFTIVMGLFALFSSIVSLGLMTYLVNEISRRRTVDATVDSFNHEFISSAAVFLLFSGILSSLLMTACGFVLSDSWSVGISTLVLSLALVPTGLVTLCEATAISYGHARLVAVSTTIENLLRTIVPLALIWSGFDMFWVCLSFAAVRFIALLVYLLVARSQLAKFTFSSRHFREIASVCLTFAGTIIFASINWQASLILLGYFSTDAEVAKYGIASRFLIPVSILMASYASVIQPTIAKHAQRAREYLGSYLSQTAQIFFIVTGVGAIGSQFLSEQVLVILFGASYTNAAATLDILALSTVPFCLVIVAAGGLVATGSQRVDLFANALGVVVCICTGVALIPHYGAVGAASAQLLSFTTMAVVELVFLANTVAGFSIWQGLGNRTSS